VIDVKTLRSMIEDKTRIGSLSQVYGHTVDDVLHIENPFVIDQIEEALIELQRLQDFKTSFDAYELLQKQGFIAYENWQECEKEIQRIQARDTPVKVILDGAYQQLISGAHYTCGNCKQRTLFSFYQF
jgi:hypothetical protein